MWRKVKAFMDEHKMLVPGDRVVAALSGGADSVCLLSILAELRRGGGRAGTVMELGIRAVHVNHGLRGAEAKRDVDFVRELCKDAGVPLEVVCRDVAAYARENGLSLEEAGRILRYQILEEAARRWESEEKSSRPVWIGVAHHQDDNVETILHHLLRGSGLKGLAGMAPVQGNRIRPLLCVRREEILAYNRKRGLSWCEDSTNESTAYTRNRIRRELIPYMTERINLRAVENILHAGEIFGQADQYLERQAEQIWNQAGEEEEGTVNVFLPVFLRQEPVIQYYVLRRMVMLAAPGQKNVTARHFEQLKKLAAGKPSGRCDLPGGLEAVRQYESLSIGPRRERGERKDENPQSKRTEKAADEGTRVLLPEVGGPPLRVENMEFQAFFWEKGTEIPKKEYTKWFDYDKIKGALFIRTRQPGDFLTLSGGGRKMLNRFLIDEKVPRTLRDEIPVLAEGHRVLWVTGYRISEYYKIAEDTHTILQVKYYGGEGNGG